MSNNKVNNMSDLISREALLKKLCAMPQSIPAKVVLDLIASAPAIKQGEPARNDSIQFILPILYITIGCIGYLTGKEDMKEELLDNRAVECEVVDYSTQDGFFTAIREGVAVRLIEK